MSSLRAHLRQAGSHGHLPFHAGCPVCRAERLAGTPPGDELLSARSRAGLAAALLAATSVPTTPAIAGEVDTEHDGGVDEKAPAGGADPGFDEGSGDTDLPVEDGPELPPASEDGEVEQAPKRESAPPKSGPEGPESGLDQPAVPPVRAPLPPITIQPEPPALEDLRDPRRKPLDRNDHRPAPETLPLKIPPPPPSGPPPSALVDETEPPAPPTVAPDTGASAAVNYEEPTAAFRPTGPGGRIHVVRQGECLWSIAHDQIGGDPTPAQVARLVNLLWEFNGERIGTGDPDLLMVGTELRLP